jgi:nucleotide-binding universal stress UspA family protein
MTARPFQIVAALDGSEYESIVLLHALDLAARHPAADLHFVSVVPPGADVDQAVRELGGRALPAFDGFDATEWRVRMHVRSGDAGEQICGLAAELRADTIVVGRFGLHHPSSGRRSIASRVVDGATCPVLVVGFAAEEVRAGDRDCEDCVQVRAETDGERWFCPAHRAPDRVSVAPTVVDGVWTSGGLMW